MGQHQKLSKLKERLMQLQLQRKITRKQEVDILEHVRASMQFGDTELDSHLAMSDEQLIGIK